MLLKNGVGSSNCRVLPRQGRCSEDRATRCCWSLNRHRQGEKHSVLRPAANCIRGRKKKNKKKAQITPHSPPASKLNPKCKYKQGTESHFLSFIQPASCLVLPVDPLRHAGDSNGEIDKSRRHANKAGRKKVNENRETKER